MYIIYPLYAGDVSIDSDYENGKVTYLVYELDEIWNGDLLIAGTDVFAVGGELLNLLKSGVFKGFTLKSMEIRYEGDKPLPGFMQLIPGETLKIVRGEYDENASNDIYLTDNVGRLAVSDRLLKKIKPYMDKRTFKADEIFPMSKKTKEEKFAYEYVIVTPSNPFNLLPAEMRKSARRKNGTYIVKGVSGNVFISAPYLECLRQFDIDKHGYMDILEPYFLVVRGNDRKSVLSVIKNLVPQSFFIGEYLTAFLDSDGFVKCDVFYKRLVYKSELIKRCCEASKKVNGEYNKDMEYWDDCIYGFMETVVSNVIIETDDSSERERLLDITEEMLHEQDEYIQTLACVAVIEPVYFVCGYNFFAEYQNLLGEKTIEAARVLKVFYEREK